MRRYLVVGTQEGWGCPYGARVVIERSACYFVWLPLSLADVPCGRQADPGLRVRNCVVLLTIGASLFRSWALAR